MDRRKIFNSRHVIALAAIYGPFCVMALYTLLFVSCGHCKKTAFMLLPAGPGLLIGEILRRFLGFERLDDVSAIVLGLVLSLGAALSISALPLKSARWRALLLVVGCSISGFLAFCTLAMIRS